MSDDSHSPYGGRPRSKRDRSTVVGGDRAGRSSRYFAPTAKAVDGRETPKIETYDFRNPVFLSEVELRRLRLLHEDFIRYLTARLSLFLRMEFALKMAKLTTLTYQKFTDGLPNPDSPLLVQSRADARRGHSRLSIRVWL